MKILAGLLIITFICFLWSAIWYTLSDEITGFIARAKEKKHNPQDLEEIRKLQAQLNKKWKIPQTRIKLLSGMCYRMGQLGLSPDEYRNKLITSFGVLDKDCLNKEELEQVYLTRFDDDDVINYNFIIDVLMEDSHE